MLYYLFKLFVSDLSILNVFKYITVRTGLCVITSLLIILIFGTNFIYKLKKLQSGGQPIRSDGPKTHKKKYGTPTMGGLLIILSILVSVFLWADITNDYIQILIFTLIVFAVLGFYDDFLKVTKRNTNGVSVKFKFFIQSFLALAVIYSISFVTEQSIFSKIYFPFFKNLFFDLGIFYFIFAALVIIGSSNAVNLTDGLDGLAVVPIMLVAATFAVITYLVGNVVFSKYLFINYIKDTGEITVFVGAIIGACLGFLWFNSPPAKVFMGDTGSLSLGATIAVVALIIKHEIVLAIAGGLFVIEALSVIIQVLSFKMTGKRVFAMAPLHHHFEKKGWSEATVVIRFWIIAILFSLISLTTLKLR